MDLGFSARRRGTGQIGRGGDGVEAIIEGI